MPSSATLPASSFRAAVRTTHCQPPTLRRAYPNQVASRPAPAHCPPATAACRHHATARPRHRPGAHGPTRPRPDGPSRRSLACSPGAAGGRSRRPPSQRPRAAELPEHCHRPQRRSRQLLSSRAAVVPRPHAPTARRPDWRPEPRSTAAGRRTPAPRLVAWSGWRPKPPPAEAEPDRQSPDERSCGGAEPGGLEARAAVRLVRGLSLPVRAARLDC